MLTFKKTQKANVPLRTEERQIFLRVYLEQFTLCVAYAPINFLPTPKIRKAIAVFIRKHRIYIYIVYRGQLVRVVQVVKNELLFIEYVSSPRIDLDVTIALMLKGIHVLVI